MNVTKTLRSATDALKQHRKTLFEQKANVSTLNNLVAENEAKLASLESVEDGQASIYADLQREREDVLADIALGRKSHADLAEVDRRIGEATNSKRTSLAAKDAAELLRVEQSLEGLRRRRNEAVQELRNTEKLTQGIIKEFLIADAAETYASYLANAGKVIADLKRIMALHFIYEKATGDKSSPFTTFYWDKALLPTFNLPHDGAGAGNGGGLLFGTDAYLQTDEPLSVTNAETDRLRALGVFDLT